MAIVERPEPAKRESAERPIRIFLNEVPVAVSQGSPFGLSELAVGYLLSEGLIADRVSLVEVVEVPEEAAVYVASGERAEEGYVPLHRVTSAGCAQSALLRDARRAGEPRALETA
ncbi:MAG: formate dehydrogenase accessory sulfurtransferase FdhD, partial [Eggerthella lenta]